MFTSPLSTGVSLNYSNSKTSSHREEGRHIYHRNNNGLEDSEDYASFYGEQFKNYYNRVAGDTSLVMIGSELGYNAGQLGNDWEDDLKLYFGSSGREIGAGLSFRKEYTIGIAIGDNKEKIYFITDKFGVGLGGGMSAKFVLGVGTLKGTNNPKDIQGSGHSFSATITYKIISGSLSADFSNKTGGFSGTIGPALGLGGSVSYTFGNTKIYNTFNELLKELTKLPINEISKGKISNYLKGKEK